MLASGGAHDVTPGAGSSLAGLPVTFTPNRGQLDGEVRYHAQGPGFGFFFTAQKAVLALEKGEGGQALELSFVGANPNARLESLERAAGRVNYLVGPTADHHADIPTYEALVYRDLWPGIDMVFRGSGGALKYEFHLEAGADPTDIRLAWGGAGSLSTDEAGRLLIATPLGRLTDARPTSWQRLGGRRVPVRSRYALERGRTHVYGFTLGRYDRHRPLVIDPSLSYSTFLGGSSQDWGEAIALDVDGNAYVTGTAYSTDFPTTAGAYDRSLAGYGDAFVAKLSPDGSALEYSTFLGGSYAGETETGYGIAVDGDGSAYVGGYTRSDDFPTTPGAYDRTLGSGYDGDGFVAKLSPDGSALVYATYLGGNGREIVRDLAVDASDNAYATGFTGSDAFVTKLNSTGSGLSYSRILGGTSYEGASGIAIDAQGAAYITGTTGSADFPTTAGAFDTVFSAQYPEYDGDGFLTKLDPTGAIEYSTFLGGNSDDSSNDVAVDDENRAYVTGRTYSADFPTTPGAYERLPEGSLYGGGMYVTRLTADGSALSYSTLLGASFGCCTANAYGIAVDAQDGAYVTGETYANFPTTPGAFDTTANPGYDAFLSRLSPDGSELVYSTYLGGGSDDSGHGVAVDSAGVAHVTGQTYSLDFTTTDGAHDETRNGFYPDSNSDAFVMRLVTSGPELSTGRLIVKKDAHPNSAQDFSFTAGGGLTPSTFQLDDDPSDSTLGNRRVFGSIASGSYSIAEATTEGWLLTSATCDDGSPPDNIDVAPAEEVVCTFVNEYRAGYARPKGAPFLDVRLVPAFQECTNADAEHGAPLAVPSCSPPVQSSDFLTFNAPDREPPHFNDPALGSAKLRLQLICTNGSSSPCDSGYADVKFTGSVTDVRCVRSSGGCSGPGAAYSGKLLFEIPLRITDRQNGPSENIPATLLDETFTFKVGVVCVEGDCNLDSSAETAYPADVVKEGKRAIWEVGRPRVLDGGQDGDFDGPPDCPPACYPNDNETLFLEQGLFVP